MLPVKSPSLDVVIVQQPTFDWLYAGALDQSADELDVEVPFHPLRASFCILVSVANVRGVVERRSETRRPESDCRARVVERMMRVWDEPQRKQTQGSFHMNEGETTCRESNRS